MQQASDKPADESNQDIHQISFPRYEDIKAECPDAKYQYLFTLDDTAFFRVALSHADKMHILEVTGGKFINRHYMRSAAPKEYVLAAITGFHLDGWYDKNHFCGRCANRLVEDDVERMLRCPVCGNMVYPRINPAVIVGVTNGDKLLLTKYNGREYKKYALVAGFNEIGESLEETVRREVMEETGLRVKTSDTTNRSRGALPTIYLRDISVKLTEQMRLRLTCRNFRWQNGCQEKKYLHP